MCSPAVNEPMQLFSVQCFVYDMSCYSEQRKGLFTAVHENTIISTYHNKQLLRLSQTYNSVMTIHQYSPEFMISSGFSSTPVGGSQVPSSSVVSFRQHTTEEEGAGGRTSVSCRCLLSDRLTCLLTVITDVCSPSVEVRRQFSTVSSANCVRTPRNDRGHRSLFQLTPVPVWTPPPPAQVTGGSDSLSPMEAEARASPWWK